MVRPADARGGPKVQSAAGRRSRAQRRAGTVAPRLHGALIHVVADSAVRLGSLQPIAVTFLRIRRPFSSSGARATCRPSTSTAVSPCLWRFDDPTADKSATPELHS